MVVLIHMRVMTWMAMAEAPAVPDLSDLTTMDYLGLDYVVAGIK